jgi:hypothetical protein
MPRNVPFRRRLQLKEVYPGASKPGIRFPRAEPQSMLVSPGPLGRRFFAARALRATQNVAAIKTVAATKKAAITNLYSLISTEKELQGWMRRKLYKMRTL